MGTGTALRAGVVGAGFIGSRHARALASMEGVRLVAVADTDLSRAGGLAGPLGAQAYADPLLMLDEAGLDALWICVPPAAHARLEDAALDRGVPFFVEKPLSVDLATAEAVAERVRTSGLPTATGYHWRYLDTVERARALLADRPPRMLIGSWLDKAPGVAWWSREGLSGGQTVEQATHLFDLVRHLGGEVEVVYAVGTASPDGPGDVLHASTAALHLDGGAVAAVSSTCLLRRGHRIALEVVCDGLVLLLTEREMVVDDGSGPSVVPVRRDPLVAEDADFLAAVRGDTRAVRVPYGEALRSHRVALAAAASARRGGCRVRPGEKGLAAVPAEQPQP